MFFKKRALQVSVVTPSNKNGDNTTCDHLDPDKLNEIAKDYMKHVALVVVGVLAVSTLLHTVSEIVINASKPKEE